MNNERILELALAADPDIGRTLGDLNGKCWIAANGIRPQSVVKFAELIVRECGYYADVFESLGCPVDMDPTETKPSDYIKREMGITE